MPSGRNIWDPFTCSYQFAYQLFKIEATLEKAEVQYRLIDNNEYIPL